MPFCFWKYLDKINKIGSRKPDTKTVPQVSLGDSFTEYCQKDLPAVQETDNSSPGMATAAELEFHRHDQKLAALLYGPVRKNYEDAIEVISDYYLDGNQLDINQFSIEFIRYGDQVAIFYERLATMSGIQKTIKQVSAVNLLTIHRAVLQLGNTAPTTDLHFFVEYDRYVRMHGSHDIGIGAKRVFADFEVQPEHRSVVPYRTIYENSHPSIMGMSSLRGRQPFGESLEGWPLPLEDDQIILKSNNGHETVIHVPNGMGHMAMSKYFEACAVGAISLTERLVNEGAVK